MRRRPQRTRRKVGQRERRTVIRVLTEGEVTEPQYLRLICSDSVKLDIRNSKRTTPMQLVKQAKRDLRADRRVRAVNRSFDEVWCIFDRDDHHRFGEAVQAAANADIPTVVSNPCFELWLILHVTEQTAHISTSMAQTRAGQLNLVDGKDLATANLDALRNSCLMAKHRALELDRMHERNGSPPRANPSSEVWRLVDRLRGPSD